ncbi:CoA transferase [Halopiger thermotolerans]
MLANQGAEVIKIERPGVGDDNRYSGPPFVDVGEHDGPGRSAAEEGESPYFWTINYGKRSVELDLKSEQGKEALYDLVREADVFVENFRPGTAERLAVDYDTIREYNDDVVYCSISAFGETGPWSQRPGYDLLIQGLSGIMSVTGEPDGQPVKVGLPQTDLITGMWAAFGIVNALLRRERTGEGERVELGMLDAALPWLTKQAGKVFADEEPERMGTKDPVLAPYQAFPTADGHLNVACGNQRLWEQLCDAIGREELKRDERFATNAARVEHMDELEVELSETFRSRTTDEWVDLLAEEHGLPVGPVFDVEEALTNEQVNAREVVTEMEHPAGNEIPVIEHPLNYEYSEAGFDGPPPLLGEDTEAVLLELGYSEDELGRLRENGVIPDPEKT